MSALSQSPPDRPPPSRQKCTLSGFCIFLMYRFENVERTWFEVEIRILKFLLYIGEARDLVDFLKKCEIFFSTFSTYDT